MSGQNTEAYQAGYRAGKLNQSIDDNPYRHGTEGWAAWRAGFYDAQDE